MEPKDASGSTEKSEGVVQIEQQRRETRFGRFMVAIMFLALVYCLLQMKEQNRHGLARSFQILTILNRTCQHIELDERDVVAAFISGANDGICFEAANSVVHNDTVLQLKSIATQLTQFIKEYALLQCHFMKLNDLVDVYEPRVKK